MTTQDLINTLKQGKPMTDKLVREIVRELEDLKKLKEAVRPAVDGYMKVKDQATWDGQRVVPEMTVLGGCTVAQYDKLAALVGEG